MKIKNFLINLPVLLLPFFTVETFIVASLFEAATKEKIETPISINWRKI